MWSYEAWRTRSRAFCVAALHLCLERMLSNDNRHWLLTAAMVVLLMAASLLLYRTTVPPHNTPPKRHRLQAGAPLLVAIMGVLVVFVIN